MAEHIPKSYVALWLGLIALEGAASFFAYWTVGWIAVPMMFAFSMFLNFVAFYVSLSRLRGGLALAVGFALVIVGYQGVLGIRFYFVNTEAKRIVEWVSDEVSRTGSPPEDSSGFEFRYPSYKEYIRYARWVSKEEAKWQVTFTIGTTSTDYRYTKENGWYYNDD